jgi:uracil phosphoribosyltransferase
MSAKVHVVGHPLIQHKLTLMRNKHTPTNEFRTLLREISLLLAYEVCRDLPTRNVDIETPLQKTQLPILAGKKIVLASVLRAGNGMLDGMLQILPSARVGFIGLYRDAQTLEPVEYYFKMPQGMSERHAIVVDPMLATGNSATAAVNKLKTVQPKSIKFACLLAAPEGIETFHRHHPDVEIYTPAVDECLNEKGYILPGLGDAGDRMFGT